MIATIRSYIYAIIAGVGVVFAALIYRKGVTDTKGELEVNDLKKANTIRRRADAARELHSDGIKYRD